MISAVSLEAKGHATIAFSLVFFVFASYAMLFHLVAPVSEESILAVVTNDKHYKYFFLLVIPTGAYFVIANWVGWQYYRNA